MSQNLQPLLWKEVDDMSDKADVSELIQKYADLQQIIKAEDPRKEAERQLAVIKTRLDAYGNVSLDALDRT